jgi:hypothetical protein
VNVKRFIFVFGFNCLPGYNTDLAQGVCFVSKKVAGGQTKSSSQKLGSEVCLVLPTCYIILVPCSWGKKLNLLGDFKGHFILNVAVGERIVLCLRKKVILKIAHEKCYNDAYILRIGNVQSRSEQQVAYTRNPS